MIGHKTNDLSELIEFKLVLKDWKNTLLKVKKFINENNRLPCRSDNSWEIKSLSYWIVTQLTNYNSDFNMCRQIMKNIEIKTLWEEFTNEYPNMFTIHAQYWKNKLLSVKDFVNKNNILPSFYNTDNEEIKSLGIWINNQYINYNSDINMCRQIMKNPEIKTLWEEFINQYPNMFITPEQYWKDTLIKVKEFLNQKYRLPHTRENNEEIKFLSRWFLRQKENYNSDINKCKYIMKNPEIKTLWEEFMNVF